MTKRIFITGGTGFLGLRVINRFQKESVELLGLTRSEQSRNKLSELGLTIVSGSMEDIEQWKDQLEGVDVVVHCAAPVEFWGPWEKFQKGMIDATVDLYIASENAGVKRFVYISSESVLQSEKDLIDIDENEPYPKEPNSFYGKSKMLAEKFILSQNGHMQSVILRPTFIWGKGVKGLVTILEKIKSNDFMWIDSGKSLFEMVHVDNVAESIALASEKGTNKSIYFVTDESSQSVKSFLTKLITTKGVEPPDKSMPKGIASMLAGTVEFVWKTFGLKSIPPITKFDVAFVAMGRRYNIAKIKNELGYRPIVSEEQGLESMRS